jgi:hypothetical protein
MGFIVADSVTHLTDTARGMVAACASHGGAYAAIYAARTGIAALILNDAGIGRERAGVGGVLALDALGVPAAAVSHLSCRIGDGADMAARGVLSTVNDAARRLGLLPDMTCRDALDRLAAAGLPPAPMPAPMAEARHRIDDLSTPDCAVFALDSAGLIGSEDLGQVVITGSHGGLLGGKPASASKVDVRAAIFNDAGIGADLAGLSRLPALAARGIAAFTVSCFSARIGEGLSSLNDGFVSALNAPARAAGVEIGLACRAAVRRILAYPVAGR